MGSSNDIVLKSAPSRMRHCVYHLSQKSGRVRKSHTAGILKGTMALCDSFRWSSGIQIPCLWYSNRLEVHSHNRYMPWQFASRIWSLHGRKFVEYHYFMLNFFALDWSVYPMTRNVPYYNRKSARVLDFQADFRCWMIHKNSEPEFFDQLKRILKSELSGALENTKMKVKHMLWRHPSWDMMHCYRACGKNWNLHAYIAHVDHSRNEAITCIYEHLPAFRVRGIHMQTVFAMRHGIRDWNYFSDIHDWNYFSDLSKQQHTGGWCSLQDDLAQGSKSDVCVCVFVYVCVCVCIFVKRFMNKNVFFHNNRIDDSSFVANTYVCIHTCIRTYVHTYIHTYIHTYTHTYIHAKFSKINSKISVKDKKLFHDIQIDDRSFVAGWFSCCSDTYIHTYTHTHIHTYIHTYIHTSFVAGWFCCSDNRSATLASQVHIHLSMYVCIHTYVWYIHTYIRMVHTYKYV